MVSKREESYDILKGIGIFLMLYAHTYFTKSFLWPFIMSFHMPLFFILSGLFLKPRGLLYDQIKKDGRRLLLPFLFITSCQILLTVAYGHFVLHEFSFDLFNSLYMGATPSWFLLALFGAKTLFGIIVKMAPQKHVIVSFIVSTASMVLTKIFCLSPLLSLTSATGSVIFISIGYFASQHQLVEIIKTSKFRPIIVVISAISWLNSSYLGEIDVHLNVYKLWFIDYLGACGGTCIFFMVSMEIEKHWSLVKKVYSRIGFHSLTILSYHSIEFCFPSWFQVVLGVGEPFVLPTIFICRLLMAWAATILTLRVPILKKLFYK